MAQITDRDIKIFKALAYGVASIRMIRRLLADVHGISMTQMAIEKRLSLLRADGYVISRNFPRYQKHGHLALYSLTARAVSSLTILGYPVEQIRLGLPGAERVLHEIVVTKILHAAAREVKEKGFYDFSFADPTILIREREKWSRHPVPDVRLDMRFRDGRKFSIHLEIDMGTVPLLKMARRLRVLGESKYFVIVYCSKESRIESLREACLMNHVSRTAVHFGLQDDFVNRAFQSTYVTIDGERRRLLMWREADRGSAPT